MIGPLAGLQYLTHATLTTLTCISLAFKQECSMLYAANGDAALAASDYDRAFELYSAAIDLGPATDIIIANRSKAKCHALLQAGRLEEAIESCRRLMDMTDETTMAS